MRTRKIARSPAPTLIALAIGCIGGVAHAQSSPTALPAITVIEALPDRLEAIPGSVHAIGPEQLEAQRPLSIMEAVREAPGVHVVGEDAFGLNLNIGVRGLDPRRSSRTLLLEDGAPIQLAPYADPTTHYHTPLERIRRIEVIKGSGQIVHGPQTVGGVINFVTQDVPRKFQGSVQASAGSRDFYGLSASVGTGGDWGGVLLSASQKEGDGTRRGNEHKMTDVSIKALLNLNARNTLMLKYGYFEEDSKFGEAGLDQARYERDPYANPFRDDRFELERNAAQAVHTFQINEEAKLTTNMYYSKVDRASYRQLDAIAEEDELETLRDGDPVPLSGACPANIDYTVPNGFEDFARLCGNNMRPRTYETFGIEPRLDLKHNTFGIQSELVMGVRLHWEDVSRKRYNGAFSTARENSIGTLLRDDFRIKTDALSGYVQNTFYIGNWSLTPGVRYEQYRQTFSASTEDFNPVNARLSDKNDKVLPGFGVTWFGLPDTTVFAGVHRGFAPPRPDATLSPFDADYVAVSPELSTNYELGMRSAPLKGVQLEATLFRIDFKNQIVPGQSLGLGQTFANGGETRKEGLELGGRIDFGRMHGSAHNVYLKGSYTHLWTARFENDVLNTVYDAARNEIGEVNVNGNRTPYAPRHLLAAAIGYEHASGFDVRLGVEHISEQYTDGLNSKTPLPDGQSGEIDAQTIFNASANYRLKPQGMTLFLSAANLTDRTYIVSRVNGIHVNRPRQVIAGVRWDF